MLEIVFFNIMYNKTIIRFRFCNILNNQGLGKCYQPRLSARLMTLTSTLIKPDITKTSTNNCLKHDCKLDLSVSNYSRYQVERLMTSVIAFGITVDWLRCEANCHTLLDGG